MGHGQGCHHILGHRSTPHAWPAPCLACPSWGGEMQPRGGSLAPGREINGYPFTTFTDFSDFLGIIPRVSSDDLAYYVDSHWSIESTRFYRLHGVDCSPRFCRKFVLQRNRFIKRVELFEPSPILLLSRWSGGLLVVVFEASRQTAKPAARTIETSPDKKMRVGSLHNP